MKLKTKLLLVLALLKVAIGYSQTEMSDRRFANCDSTIDLVSSRCDAETDSIKRTLQGLGLLNLINDRERNLKFYKTLTLISEPSTLSCLSDITINENPYRQKKPFILNADVQTPVTLGGKKWRLNTIQVIPQIKIRIFNNDNSRGDSSLPVRTPSFIPALVYYFSFKSWQNGTSTSFGGFKAFHHSNGQDGNEINPNGLINIYNGNFGENAAFELIYGRVKEIDFNNSNTQIHNALYYYKLGFEFHPKPLTNEDFYKYKIYGRNRINIQFGWLYSPLYDEFLKNLATNYCYVVAKNLSKEKFRIVFNLNYITDIVYNTGDNINMLHKTSLLAWKRLNLYGTAYWIIPGSINASLFFQAGYWGSDNYNIYFQQSIWHFRSGLAFAFYNYPKSGDIQKPVYLQAN